MKKIKLSLVAFLISFIVFSQKSKISGTVLDENKKTIEHGVVMLLTPKDSILYKFTRTDNKGNFELKNLNEGNYIFMVSHNKYADYVENIDLSGDKENQYTIDLISKNKLIEEITIKANNGSIRIKGDTTNYKASDFKVDANANVEELLKKLPGIQVGKNGEIKAMGETVKKVLVDGELFFGDDPGMAVKNLRADAVKTVQVYDKKSDQAEFTGIDDGNTEKTINLKLNEESKKGYFGKVAAANGPPIDIDSRYNINLLYGSFKGKRKLSAFLLNGNTGQDGLSWEDSDRFGGDNISFNMDEDGNTYYMWNGGSEDDEPYIDTENGFIKNTNAGINYSNKWNENKTLNFSPKFNNQIYNNNNKSYTKTQIGNTQLIQNTNKISNITRFNFKINTVFDVKLDTMNTLKFNFKTNFYSTKGSEFSEGNTTDENFILKNKQNILEETNLDKSSLSAGVLFNHRFKKKRRTFSANLTWNSLNSTIDNFLKSNNESYLNGTFLNNIAVNQNKTGSRKTQNGSLNLSYTEPLSKNITMQFAYDFFINRGENNQVTNDFNNLTNLYDVKVNDLSNEFLQAFITQKPSLRFNYNSKKITVNLGSGFGFTTFDLLDKTFNNQYKQSFTNFFPFARFTYKYKSNASLNVRYNGSTTQPTLEQLQPLRNNQDFFNQSIGNPDLKQSFTNSIYVTNNSYDMINDTYIYQSLSFSSIINQISYNSDIDLTNAKTIRQAINTNGNYSFNFYMGYGFKLKKIDLRVDISPRFYYRNSVISINQVENNSKNFNSSFNLSLNKSKEKAYDFSISNNFSFNNNSTTQNNQSRSFNTNNLKLDASIYFSKNWKISTDYNLFTRQKTDDFQTNLNNQLWNAKLERNLLNDEFTAYLLVRDILNQNTGIDRFNQENTIGEIQNDRLKRYFMLGFTWNFKNKNTTK